MDVPDSLAGFFDRIDAVDQELTVLNRESPDPIQNMLEGAFADQPVDVNEASIERADLPTDANADANADRDADIDADAVDLVVLTENGEVVATSSLSELLDTVLLVNSDLYTTGTRNVEEVKLPDVLAALDETRFRLRGYPESDREKMLLITISRVIERKALEAAGGTLRSSFQRLSRIDDESGTRRVYERLADTATGVHVYGVPNRVPDMEVSIHGGRSEEYRRAWFVVFTPPPGGDDHAALVAIETDEGTNVWDGFWTYRPELVEGIDAYISANL